MALIYASAVTLNGYIADPAHSVDWLTDVPHEGAQPNTFPYTALVMGSHTYEWYLRHEQLLEQPAKWQQHFGVRPVFVFSRRG